MICPPKKSKLWNNFVKRVGNLDVAHTIFFLKDGDIESITDEEIASYLTSEETSSLITPNDKIIWGHPGIGKTFLRQTNQNVIDFDSDYKSRINEKYNLPEGFKARNEWRTFNPELWKEEVRQLWSEAKEESRVTGKQLLASDMLMLREFPNDFDKVINIPDETFVERAKQRNDYTEVETEQWKANINQILQNIDQSKIIQTDKYISDLIISTQTPNVSFKPISITTLSPLKQIDFRDSLKVGNKLTFNYWDEDAQTEKSEEDFVVEKIDRNNFTGTSANGTNTINYSDVVDTSIDKTLTFKDRRIFFDNLSVGKFVKINTVYGPIEGVVSNFDSESFTVGENIIKYSEIYKSNEIVDFEMKLQELRRTLNNQLLVTKNIKTAEQKRRVDSLRNALDNLNRYGGDLEDLHGLFVTMKENFDRVKATIKNISDPAKQMTPEKLLYTISYAKNYIDSFTGLRSINTSIQNFEGSTELKAASSSLVATLTNVQDEYFDIAIPKLAEVLWKQFNPRINKELLKVKKDPWTLERLIQELRNPTRDIDSLNTYFVAPTNANDIIVALFTKTLKAAREAARALDEKLLRNITPLIDRVKSKMDINEAMKSFYTEVDMQVIEDGEEKTIKVRKFIDKHNVDDWYSTTNLIYQERQLLYDQLATAKLNNNIAESQKLSALIRGLNRRLQMFREAKGIQITGDKFKIEMERHKEFDEPKFWKFLDSYYKRVELDATNSSTVSVINEETGETEYYNYSGNRWIPNMDLYLTKEYETLEKGDQDVFNLYKFVKDEYDKANYKIPMSYRLNNVVPSMYAKNFLDSIQKSAQNFFEDNNKQYLVRMDGRAYKEIPIGFTKIMDVSKSDDNILRSTLMFITEANNYATMNEQYGSVDAITQVLANNNPLDETQQRRIVSDINNRKEAIKKIIKQTYYGEKNTTHGMAGKTIDALSKFTALTRLALKPLNWASNFLRGNFENMSEAIGGRHYNLDNLKWANKEFMKLQARNPKKLANMIRSLDAVQGRFMKSFGDEFLSFKEKYASTEVLFLGQDIGEVQIQGTAMLALLKAWNIQIPEDGNFDMDNLPEYFVDTLHAINKHNHGVYNDFDRLYAQDNALFRLFLQFRKYIIPTFRSRYSGIFSGEHRIDYEAGTVERGFYREFGEYIYNSFKNFESVPNMIASFKTLDSVQQEGVKRTMVDLVGFFGFMVMSSLFKPGDDEEDEDDIVSNIRWHIAYQFARLKGDLGTYIPIFGTKDQLRIINNPFAAVPVISDVFSLFSALGDISPDKNGNWWLAKEYLRNTATRQKGELKIFGTLSKLNPLDNVLETFFPEEMYDKFDKASQR